MQPAGSVAAAARSALRLRILRDGEGIGVRIIPAWYARGTKGTEVVHVLLVFRIR